MQASLLALVGRKFNGGPKISILELLKSAPAFDICPLHCFDALRSKAHDYLRSHV
jgi:hypothetical protein